MTIIRNPEEALVEREDVSVEDMEVTKTPVRQQQVPSLEPSSEHLSEESEEREESAEERRRREEEQSIELARMLMAEEAMASYQHSFEVLRQSANQLSQEDFDALQAVLEEEQNAQVEDLEDEEGNLSYDAMLQLGERIGDVKTERWAIQAKQFIEKLPSFRFDPSPVSGSDVDDSECKCLVCQCEYEKDEHLKKLPCGHCYHAGCVDQWLSTKDICPYCRQSVVKEN